MTGQFTKKRWISTYFAINKITYRGKNAGSLVGAPTYKLLRDLCYSDLTKSKRYAELCRQLLTKQYSSQVSERRERIKFYDLQQQVSKSISEWYARIRSASIYCNFDTQLTEEQKNKFVVGLRKGKVLDQICEEAITEELSTLVSTTQKKDSTAEGKMRRIIQKKHPHSQLSSSPNPKPNNGRQHPQIGDSMLCRGTVQAYPSQKSTPRLRPPEEIRCYGCNAPGVVRKNCLQCNRDTGFTNVHVNNVGFCATRLKPRLRSAVTIEVAGTTGTAFLDTAAGSSVASVSLFQRLRETSHPVHYKTVDATFADGSIKTMKVPTIRTNIALHGRVIAATFVTLSENAATKTLLGADFIEGAGLILDLGAKRFHFRDDADVTYPMTPKDGVIEITSQQPNDLRLAAAETAPRPTTVHSEPMEAENYGPPIPGASVAVQPPGVWNIYQAPGAFEYMWAAADSATDMFMDATDYATPLEFSSLHLKTQENADYTPNE
ncbi:uncharacterized protein [Tenebrio molitor]|uniref:uncharacterized protein n=1 Tax=Tenebrio molitor TaxID=7067 RepID=UPI0036248134